MPHPPSAADEERVSFRLFLCLIAGALVLAALAGESSTATAGAKRCGVDTAGNGGYAYAGHQATHEGHGARATITLTRELEVASGHVAGWVGVGGPGQGPNGEDAWIQVGVGAMEGMEPFLYAEVTRPGRYPKFILVEEGIKVGESRSLAVLEMAGRPNWWRVWVDRKPVTKPVRILGSSGKWAPIATAESFNGGTGACNRFAYRFESVLVSHGRGGAWKPFQSGHRFLDSGYRLRALATAPSRSRNERSLSRSGPDPYAFLATS
jgi:hypothetical protein